MSGALRYAGQLDAGDPSGPFRKLKQGRRRSKGRRDDNDSARKTVKATAPTAPCVAGTRSSASTARPAGAAPTHPSR